MASSRAQLSDLVRLVLRSRLSTRAHRLACVPPPPPPLFLYLRLQLHLSLPPPSTISSLRRASSSFILRISLHRRLYPRRYHLSCMSLFFNTLTGWKNCKLLLNCLRERQYVYTSMQKACTTLEISLDRMWPSLLHIDVNIKLLS